MDDCYVLTCWPGQKCHSRWCTGRKWHILTAVMRGNREGGNWLMKWDEVKISHDTLIDWRTGGEWPLNCMTVISAWWRLNIRFQRSSGRRTIIKFSWVRRASWIEFRFQLSSTPRGPAEWPVEFQTVGEEMCRERHIRPKGSWALMSWGPEKMLIRCVKEASFQQSGP